MNTDYKNDKEARADINATRMDVNESGVGINESRMDTKQSGADINVNGVDINESRMGKDEILRRSREENKNGDEFTLKTMACARGIALLVVVITLNLFFFAELIATGNINYGYYAVILSSTATINLVTAIRMKSKARIIVSGIFCLTVLVLIVAYLLRIFGV